MQLYETLIGPDGRNLTRLSRDLDLTNEETTAVLNSVLPELSHNIERRTLSRGGLADIVQQLGDPQSTDYLTSDTDLTASHAIEEGNDVLGQILETKYRSRALADRAEAASGVPAEKIRQMLPRIANVSMGALRAQTGSQLQDIFSRLPEFSGDKSQRRNQSTTSGQQNSPLPLPGDDWGGNSRNRYDDAADILRRRQGPLQSNPLWNIVRQLLGSVLGFQSKGIVGYIIRFLVYRYGWQLVRMVFGRLFRT